MVPTGTHTIIAKTNEDTTILNDTITIEKSNETNIESKTIKASERVKINIIPNASGEIRKIEKYEVISIANAPFLPEGMIPVRYNGTTLVKADMTNTNNDWYNYDNKMWANAILMSNNKNISDGVYDYSGNNRDAVFVGNPTYSNEGIVLNGAGDGIYIGNILSNLFSGSNTVQIKVKRSETNTRDILIGNHDVTDAINYEVHNNNYYRIWYKYGTTDAYKGIATYNKFILITFVFNKSNNTISIYEDSTLKGTITSSNFGAYSPIFNSVYIGRDSRTDSTCLKGTIEKVMIYDRVLTSDEISHNINTDYAQIGNDNGVIADDLLLYYDFRTQMRDFYLNQNVGTTIAESDILGYYVWIPRYKYELFNTTFTTSSPQEIEIVFEPVDNIISNGTIKGQYLSHPAFWWDNDSDGVREAGEELSGIWVGKFETSSDIICTPADLSSLGNGCNLSTINPRIVPNVTSWRGAQVSTFFNAIKKIESTTYLTTNGVNQIDSHMMKNMEWGAAAYLSHSKYGKNSELEINLNSNYLTGDGNYKTNIAQSTTGNITGIYDMSGGAWEYMMGVQQDNTKTNTPMSGYDTAYNSGFTGKIFNGSTWNDYNGISFPDKKYYDLYEYGPSNTDYTRRHLGDATGETRGWYNDRAYFASAGASWALRVGGYGYNSSAGAFAFSNFNGGAYARYGVRAVLSKK